MRESVGPAIPPYPISCSGQILVKYHSLRPPHSNLPKSRLGLEVLVWSLWGRARVLGQGQQRDTGSEVDRGRREMPKEAATMAWSDGNASDGVAREG